MLKLLIIALFIRLALELKWTLFESHAKMRTNIGQAVRLVYTRGYSISYRIFMSDS